MKDFSAAAAVVAVVAAGVPDVVLSSVTVEGEEGDVVFAGALNKDAIDFLGFTGCVGAEVVVPATSAFSAEVVVGGFEVVAVVAVAAGAAMAVVAVAAGIVSSLSSQSTS